MSRVGVLGLAVAVIAAAGTAASWQRATIAVAPPVAAPLDGAELFHSKGCATCHAGPDSRAFIDAFPSLRAVGGWAGQRREGMSAEAYLAESIRSPAAIVSPEFRGPVGGTTGMPNLGLTEAEIDAIVVYLLQGSGG